MISTHLRPIKSDSRPPTAAPTIKPKVLIDRNQPLTGKNQIFSVALILNSGPSTGRVSPGACRSTPSIMASRQHRATVRITRPPAGLVTFLACIWPPRSLRFCS